MTSQETPESCDCCGRDAEDCGIVDLGWATDRRRSGFQGRYCLGCARLLRLVRWTASCARCCVRIENEREAEAEGWGYLSDELGELHAFCPGCLRAERDHRARRESPLA